MEEVEFWDYDGVVGAINAALASWDVDGIGQGCGSVEKRVNIDHFFAHVICPFEDLGPDVHCELGPP